MRRRIAHLAAAVTIAVTAAGCGLGPAAGASSPGSPGRLANGTELATIARRTLVSQEDVAGTLGLVGSDNVLSTGRGVLTALSTPGQIITEGHALYDINNEPVYLLDGSVPAWRSLYEGVSAGPDVVQLNQDLAAMGYGSASALAPTDEFTAATAEALDKLQGALGLPETGTLPLGQAVFLPGPIEVGTVAASVGQQVGPGAPLCQASSTHYAVAVSLDPSLQEAVHLGDTVQIELPNGSNVAGRVTMVGAVATTTANQNGPGSTTTIPVTVVPDTLPASDRLDGAPVTVAITTAQANNVLVVPIASLLAQPGGGYDVAVVHGRSEKLVPVQLGLIDQASGYVAVTGSGLHVGERVTEAGS